MLDSYNRPITYLRISVTDRCNLRCTYCMPQEGVPYIPRAQLLRFEEIEQIVQVAATMGITKVRITGGEPLVRKDVPILITMIKGVPNIEFVGMTTNGSLLRQHQKALATSGLDRVNISLDTLDMVRYKELTRGGNLAMVLDGIEAMREIKIPIKINMVVSDTTSKQEITAMQKFAQAKSLDLQLIKEYNLEALKQDEPLYHRPPRCQGCNRLRILANGAIKPCLHSNIEVPIDMNHIKESLLSAIVEKPERGTTAQGRTVSSIGG